MQTFTAPTPTNGSVLKNKDSKPSFTVYETTNYSLFKIMAENRSLNLLHVKRLVQSFNERHLICPIIVNEKYQVIDGQHRLQASKETGLPVYYIILHGYGIEEVQALNTNQKNWNKLDYLDSYCEEGKQAYLDFREFMEEFPELQFRACERLLALTATGKRSGQIGGQKAMMKDFEEGKLRIPQLTKSYILARKLMEFKPYYAGFHKGIFAATMIPLFHSKVYNHKEMLHKLKTAPIRLTDCGTVESFKMLLEDIYNYKRQKENKVSFRYE